MRESNCKKEKAAYIAQAVEDKILFVLKPWQFDQNKRKKWEAGSVAFNFVGIVVFPLDWDPKRNILEYHRVSWKTVLCEACVC